MVCYEEFLQMKDLTVLFFLLWQLSICLTQRLQYLFNIVALFFSFNPFFHIANKMSCIQYLLCALECVCIIVYTK